MEDRDRPPLGTKILFWVLMGMISTFFAEVITGSTPFAFFTPVGWLVVFPIYFLHILVLSSIIFGYGRPTIYVIYPAGMIFGMYETYITKTIWGSAEWAQGTISAGGIYLIPFLFLVFFLHSFVSFILSLTVSEVLLTSSRETLSYLPDRAVKILENRKKFRRTMLIGALFLGFLWTATTPWTVPFIAELSGISVISICLYLWRNKVHGSRYSMAELLPERRHIPLFILSLLLLYILLGSHMNIAYLPGAGPQLLIWLIYVILFYILYMGLRRSRKEVKKRIKMPALDKRHILASILILVTGSALKVATGLSTVIFVILAFGMSFLGIYLFIRFVRYALIR